MAHVCDIPWYISLTPVGPRPLEKYFLMIVFVKGHEYFSYNNPKINEKDKTGIVALKGFSSSSPQVAFKRHVVLQKEVRTEWDRELPS